MSVDRRDFHIAELLLGPGYEDGGCISFDLNTFATKFTELGLRKLAANNKSHLAKPYADFVDSDYFRRRWKCGPDYDPATPTGQAVVACFNKFMAKQQAAGKD